MSFLKSYNESKDSAGYNVSLYSNFIFMKKFSESQNGNKKMHRDFPGGPVVKNLPSNAGHAGSIPSQGTKIPHAVRQLSPHAPTTELACVNERVRHAANYRAHALWSPRATTRERKPAHLIEREARVPQ